MRAAGIDETTAFHEERKRFAKEGYHYRDGSQPQDEAFNRRLSIFKKVYEDQEMDGTCRYLLAKEVEAAEAHVYEMAVRTAKPVVGEFRNTVLNRIEEARSRLLRRYKGLDADLRSGDPHLEKEAKEYLKHVSVGGAKDRWNYSAAAHERYGAQLQGGPQAEREVEAQAEIDGKPNATPDILKTFEQIGFLEREEFGMLRAEVGEEVADEFITNLQKTRTEIVNKRLKRISDQTKLNQLEKKLVLQEYNQVFNTGNVYAKRVEYSDKLAEDLAARGQIYDDFVRERDLDGDEALNEDTFKMQAEVRARRAAMIQQRRKARAARGESEGEGAETQERASSGLSELYGATAGLVQNPRNFVDPDWWALATDNPHARRNYVKQHRKDVRTVMRDAASKADSSTAVADQILGAMEDFKDFRKDNYTRGYSKSQVRHPPPLLPFLHYSFYNRCWRTTIRCITSH